MGIRSVPGCAVSAVCELNPAQLNVLGNLAGVRGSARFLHYDDLLKRARPDAVVIGTPMHLHVPQAI